MGPRLRISHRRSVSPVDTSRRNQSHRGSCDLRRRSGLRRIGNRWRLGALCTLLVSATVAPIVVLNTVASATSSPTQIVYVQKSGQQTTGPFIEYKGGGGNTSTQSLTLGSSTCSSSVSTVSNPASAPLLALQARVLLPEWLQLPRHAGVSGQRPGRDRVEGLGADRRVLQVHDLAGLHSSAQRRSRLRHGREQHLDRRPAPQ